MKKTILLLISLYVGFIANAQKEKAQTYIDAYKDAAMAEMLRSGVPASITLAQGILESAMGESELCKRSNNHFGIKCKTEWTGEKTYKDDDTKQECFRVYATAADSYKDHSDFLRTREWYAFLFKLDPTDYEGWAKGLKKAGYATEKDYPQRLIELINRYQLQQYTLLAMQRQQPINNDVAVAPTPQYIQKEVEVIKDEVAIANVSVVNNIDTAKEIEEKPDMETAVTPAGKPLEADIDATKNKYPDGVFTINHAKVIYAKAGTSMLALANQYDISFSNLLSYNDITDLDVLDTDRLIFLDKKLRKGAVDTYVAKDNESLYTVAQSQGVRLDGLMEYNKLKKDAQLNAGQKIYLRPLVAQAQKKATVAKPTAKK